MISMLCTEHYHEKSRSIQYTKLHCSLLLTATIKHSDSDQKLHSLASLSKSLPYTKIAFQSARWIKWRDIIWPRTFMGESRTLVLFSAWVMYMIIRHVRGSLLMFSAPWPVGPWSRVMILHHCYYSKKVYNCRECYIFPSSYSLYFFLIFAHLWWFWGWGFGVRVMDWVFEVGFFSWWGLVTVVSCRLSFLGLGLSI